MFKNLTPAAIHRLAPEMAVAVTCMIEEVRGVVELYADHPHLNSSSITAALLGFTARAAKDTKHTREQWLTLCELLWDNVPDTHDS